MIYELDIPYAESTRNGRGYAAARGDKVPERSGWELLAWAILEQAVDDLVVFCRWGIITTNGKCLPWPHEMKRRIKWTLKGPQICYTRVPRTIASSKGPTDHKALKAWFLSSDAQTFCNLIGCNLPPGEIFQRTVENHGGLKYVA